jgi:hypothetical protein
MPPPSSPGPTCKWTAYTPQPDRLISLAAQLRSVRPKPRRNTRVIPSAASTALTATATRDTTANARYGATRRTGYGSPTSPSRHCPAINDRRRRWAASTIDDRRSTIDDRRCAAFGQPAPAAGLRISSVLLPPWRDDVDLGVREIRVVELRQPQVAGWLSALLATSRPTCCRIEFGCIPDQLAHPYARVPAEFGISDLAGW